MDSKVVFSQRGGGVGAVNSASRGEGDAVKKNIIDVDQNLTPKENTKYKDLYKTFLFQAEL